MANFTVDIPGIGQVTVDGPFATEDSIRDLSNAVSRAQGLGADFSRIRRDTTGLFDDLHDNMDGSIGSFDRLMRQTNKNTGSFNRLDSGLNRTINGFKGLFLGSQDVQGGFGKMLQTLGDGAASITGLIPGAGAVVTAFTGVAVAAIGFIEGLQDTNTQLMAIGASFKGGIDEFQLSANDSGIAMSSLSKAIITNTESFRMLNGGLIGGSKTISKAFKNLGREQQEILYSMGYSTDEVLSGMADFAAMAKLSGRDLNMKEIAEGGSKYLRVQRELTRLSGKSADALKQERDSFRSRAEFITFLNRIGDPTLRTAVENGMLMIPEAAKDLVHSMTMNNPFTSPEMAQFMSNFPDLEREFRYLGKAAKYGSISSEEYTSRYNKALASLEQRSMSHLNNMSNAEQEILRAQREKVPILDAVYTMMESLATAGVGTGEALKSSGLAMDLVTGPEGALSKALGVFRRYDEQMSVILQSMGAVMGKFFNPTGGEFQKILDNLIEFGLDISRSLDQYVSDPNATISELWDKVYATFKDKFGEIYNITSGVLGGWLTYLGDMLVNYISKGIQYGFDSIAAGFGWKTDTQEIKEMNEYLAKIAGTEKNLVTRPVLSSAQELGITAMSESQQKQWDIYDKLNDLNEKQLQELGYKKESDRNTGGYKFIKIPNEVDVSNGSSYDARKAREGNSLGSIPKMAVGGIFEPKQGGHIIRVAEAMGPELVAPAKRGSDGKLGLEVTGAMFDNSQLLRSLVEINKNQAAMIARLGEKMDNVAGFMEKLVYEQRQANRLAV